MFSSAMNDTMDRYVLPHDDKGSGEPLVLVHAFPLDARMWQPQLDALAAHVRVIAPDLRGFGRAGTAPLPRTLDEHADDLAALLDARSIPRATLLGLSMGGYIALAFVRRHPSRLSGLILADTRASADTPEARQGRDRAIALVRSSGVEALIEELLPKLLVSGPDSELARKVRDIARSQSPEGVVAALTAMRDRLDATELLHTIAVPTLVLVGSEDRLTTVSEVRAMAEKLPNATVVELQGAGHLSNLEAPEAFNQAVLRFLRRQSSGH